MRTSTLQGVLGRLRRLTADAPDLSDADLLERFHTGREDAAFTLLLQRHGPMVLGVCRRVLSNPHEAEDAFQATFLALAQGAGAIRKQASLASWLYGVAYRVAARARTRAGQRRRYEQAAIPAGAPADPVHEAAGQEFRAILDEEVQRLPSKYRVPLVLCYLQGKTHVQIARELAWPKSSVTARLDQARNLLRGRLTRRGVTFSTGLLATVLTEEAMATLPASLTLATVRLARAGMAARAAPVLAIVGGLAHLRTPAWLAIALPVLLAAGLALAQFAAGIGPVAEPPPPAGQQANKTEKPTDSPWSKTLPGGIAVDLLGLKYHLSGPDTWFSPEGLHLPRAPLKAPLIVIPPEDDTYILEFALRVQVPAGEEPDYRWAFVPKGVLSTPTRRSTTHKVAPDLVRIAEEFPQKLARCSLRFGVAIGPWKTVVDGYTGAGVYRNEKQAIILGKTHDVEGKAAVTVSFKDLEDDVRLVIFDVEDKEHLPTAIQAENVDGLWQLEFTFDVPPAKARLFRFQTRPYQWATFANVALKPRR